MGNSKQIGGLIGPTIMVLAISEFPLVQPHLYDRQTPPVVYLSGALTFVAGLAIVRPQSMGAKLDGAGHHHRMDRFRARAVQDGSRDDGSVL